MKAALVVLFSLSVCGSAQAKSVTHQDVVGTSWEGSFKVPGQSGRIRLAFLDAANVDGDVPYVSKAIFDGFVDPVAGLLTVFDQSCAFTPRTASFFEVGGSINLYDCAGSEEEEQTLALSLQRPKKFQLPIERAELSEDSETLALKVRLPGGFINIKYLLKKVPLEIHEKAETAAWVSDFK